MESDKPYNAIPNYGPNESNQPTTEPEPNEPTTMSKSEGMRENHVKRIEEPTEEETEAIHREFEEVKSTSQNTLHPVDEDGEVLCSRIESHGFCRWSNSKPMDSYPPGYRPICQYCVKVWRDCYK